MARNVGEGVMQAVMLVGPDQGTRSLQIEGHGGGTIDPAMAGVGPMAAVMLDVEADGSHRQAQAKRKCHRPPATPDLEDQEPVGDDEPTHDHDRFDRHGRGIAPLLSRALKIVVNSFPQQTVKTVSGAERNAIQGLLTESN